MTSGAWGSGLPTGDGAPTERRTAGDNAPLRIGTARVTIAAVAMFLTLFCVGLAIGYGVANGLLVLATIFAAAYAWAIGAFTKRYWLAALHALEKNVSSHLNEEAKVQVALSPEVVRHTLWWFGDRTYGTEPGHFITRLLNLISAADETNREKLASLWPEYVQAHGVVAREPWGLDLLLSLAKAELLTEQGA